MAAAAAARPGAVTLLNKGASKEGADGFSDLQRGRGGGARARKQGFSDLQRLGAAAVRIMAHAHAHGAAPELLS